jgi:hypothetical protein
MRAQTKSLFAAAVGRLGHSLPQRELETLIEIRRKLKCARSWTSRQGLASYFPRLVMRRQMTGAFFGVKVGFREVIREDRPSDDTSG